MVVPEEPLVPLLDPVAPELMPLDPEPMLEPELLGEVVLLLLGDDALLGLVLDPELELLLALSRRHLSLALPVSRSQFCVVLPLLEDVLGDVVLELLGEEELPDDEVLGVTLEPDEPLVPLLPLPAANAAAPTANRAALTAAVRSFTVMDCSFEGLKRNCSRPWSKACAAPRYDAFSNAAQGRGGKTYSPV